MPFTITVDNIADLYLDQVRRELRTDVGFNWQGWTQAARYALDNKKNPEEALRWAETGVQKPGDLLLALYPRRRAGGERQGR